MTMNNLELYLLFSMFVTVLSSCAGEVRPSFETMDKADLAMYNAFSSFDEQIICREEVDGWRVFSGAVSFREEIERERVPGSRYSSSRYTRYRHPPKLCLSVRELKALERNAKFDRFPPIQGNSFNDHMQPADAADYPSTFN